MTPNDYQKLAARTLIAAPGFEIPGGDMMLVWCALGLTGEAGEVADSVKKGVLHRHGLNYAALEIELGDVLWYVAALCTLAGVDMGTVMALNIEKLKRRYPGGFSSEDSKRRVDVEAGG